MFEKTVIKGILNKSIWFSLNKLAMKRTLNDSIRPSFGKNAIKRILNTPICPSVEKKTMKGTSKLQKARQRVKKDKESIEDAHFTITHSKNETEALPKGNSCLTSLM